MKAKIIIIYLDTDFNFVQVSLSTQIGTGLSYTPLFMAFMHHPALSHSSKLF